MHHDEIVDELLQFIYDSNPAAEDAKPLPLDKSLDDLGIMDFFSIQDEFQHTAVKNAVFLPVDIRSTQDAFSRAGIVLGS